MAIIKNPNTIIGVGGTNDYEELENKPQINSTELSGNKTPDQLGLQKSTHSLTTASDVSDSNEIPVYDGSGNKKVLFSTIKTTIRNFLGIVVNNTAAVIKRVFALYSYASSDSEDSEDILLSGDANKIKITMQKGAGGETITLSGEIVGNYTTEKLTLVGIDIPTKENKPTYEEVFIEESEWTELDEPVGAYTHYCEYEASEVPEEEHETSIVNDGSDCFLVNGIVIREINDEFITFYSVGVPEDASFKVAYREV